MKQNVRIVFVSIFFIFSCVSVSIAASVTVIPSGGNTFLVQGGDMNGVAGIDLSLSYDASTLSSPSVNQGALVSGAIFLANANNPGNIKIAIVSTKVFSGSGTIATISFGSQSGIGSISSISAKMININGGDMAVQASIAPAGSISTPPVPEPITTASTAIESTPVTIPSAATPGVSSSLGTISLPQDVQAPVIAAVSESAPTVSQAQTPAASAQSARAPEPASSTNEPEVAVSAPVQINYISIAERFRLYQGLRTPITMTGLFQKPIADSVRQEPAVVVSDGKTSFKLFVDIVSTGNSAPNFAFTGAKPVSLKSAAGPGRWLVEATPQKNAQKISVIIIAGGSFIEYPVTSVLPMAAISGKEADFTEFLKDSGAKKPRFDLNGDGKHDYLDDYIYTGNYLILKGAGRK